MPPSAVCPSMVPMAVMVPMGLMVARMGPTLLTPARGRRRRVSRRRRPRIRLGPIIPNRPLLPHQLLVLAVRAVLAALVVLALVVLVVLAVLLVVLLAVLAVLAAAQRRISPPTRSRPVSAPHRPLRHHLLPRPRTRLRPRPLPPPPQRHIVMLRDSCPVPYPNWVASSPHSLLSSSHSLLHNQLSPSIYRQSHARYFSTVINIPCMCISQC